MSKSTDLVVYRRYSEFGKDINLNNDALGGRIVDLSVDTVNNNMVVLPLYGSVYYKNIDSITVDDNLLFFNKPSIQIDNVKHTAVSTGTIIMYPSSTPPDGWLICMGQAVSRNTYAILYSYIGTTYGNGNNSTTFNLPDIRDRMVIHQTESISRYNSLGEAGGNNGIVFTASQLPNHTHNSSTEDTSFIAKDDGWTHTHEYASGSDAYRNGYGGWFSRSAKGITDKSFDKATGLQNHSHPKSESSSEIYPNNANLTNNITFITPNITEKKFNNIQPSQLIYYIIKY